MSNGKSGVVIVGAGQAGAMTAIALRQLGYSKDIEIIGAEPYAPYQRPPLSKEWLCAETSLSELEIRSPDFYEKKSIRLRLETEIMSIDPVSKTVSLCDGTKVLYEHLVCAFGASPVTFNIPGSTLGGVLTLRHLSDARRLKGELQRARRMVIVGGGFIGLEVAASARKLGLDVTVIEKAQRVLSRVASPVISKYMQNKHACQGVRIVCGVGVNEFKGRADRVSQVVLDNGEEIDCDCVLIGVGATPNDVIAKAAGLECNGGIVVDPECRTSAAQIYGVGDCTAMSDAVYDPKRLRVGNRFESIAAANDQARRAAASICGKRLTATEVPWFWSDQYDVKLQMAGITENADRSVIRGDVSSNAFSILHLRDKTVISVEAVNNPASFVLGKKLIASGARIDPIIIADPNSNLASVMADKYIR